MPSLPVVSGKQTARALERAGFELQRIVGSHATYLHPDTERRVTVPLGGKDLKKGTLRGILRQAGLPVESFRQLLR